MRPLASILFSFVLASSTAGAATSLNVTVHVTAIPCKNNPIAEPHTTIWNLADGSQTSAVTAVRSNGDQFDLDVPVHVGHFILLFEAGSCSTKALVDTLPGIDRRISVALTNSGIWDFHSYHALAGILPFDGLSVKIAARQGAMLHDPIMNSDIPGEGFSTNAKVEGRAYYFTALKPARYTLIVTLADFSSATFDVVIPDTNGQSGVLTIKNISQSELGTRLQPLSAVE